MKKFSVFILALLVALSLLFVGGEPINGDYGMKWLIGEGIALAVLCLSARALDRAINDSNR